MWKRVAQAAGLLSGSALTGSGQDPGRALTGSGQNPGRVLTGLGQNPGQSLTGSGQKSESGVDRIMMTSASGLTGSKNGSGQLLGRV